jgi:hypothetical protein
LRALCRNGSFVYDGDIERCTGFLISDHEVLTNDHCIEKTLLIEHAEGRVLKNLPCQGLGYIHFVASDENPNGLSRACDSIEIRSGETGIASEDYAILKLKNSVTDRAPLRISARGFQDQEASTLIRVQMDPVLNHSPYDGVQSKLNCQASYATFLYPGVTSAASPLMTFGDCAVAAGNSGSPILNSDGEIGSILQGFLLPRTQNTELNLELAAAKLDSKYGQVAIGTQLDCIPEISGLPACANPEPLPTKLPVAFIESSALFSEPHTAEYHIGLNRFFQVEWRDENAN